MSFGGDNPGDDFRFDEWDDSNLMGFNPNDDELQRILHPFECPCHGFGFSKKADLNRHLAKETKRFLCEVDECPSTQTNGDAPVFGTLNDKKRHYRDVHGTDLNGKRLPKFTCPWSNCKRHTDGFPRPKNLENHLKSLHDNQRPEPVAAADHTVPTAPMLQQMPPAPMSEGMSSATVSFAAPPVLDVPAATSQPSFDPTNPTPPDSQRVEPDAIILTPAEAADPVVSQYEENISSIRAENDTRSSRLAKIERDLVSMQAAFDTMKQEIAASRATEQFLEHELAKRKEIIRAKRTRHAEQRRAAAASAAAAATANYAAPPNAATSPAVQND